MASLWRHFGVSGDVTLASLLAPFWRLRRRHIGVSCGVALASLETPIWRRFGGSGDVALASRETPIRRHFWHHPGVAGDPLLGSGPRAGVAHGGGGKIHRYGTKDGGGLLELVTGMLKVDNETWLCEAG